MPARQVVVATIFADGNLYRFDPVGETWADVAMPDVDIWRQIATDHQGTWVAVAGDYQTGHTPASPLRLAYSTDDADSWQFATLPSTGTHGVLGVFWDGERWVAAGDKIWISDDAVTWTIEASLSGPASEPFVFRGRHHATTGEHPGDILYSGNWLSPSDVWGVRPGPFEQSNSNVPNYGSPQQPIDRCIIAGGDVVLAWSVNVDNRIYWSDDPRNLAASPSELWTACSFSGDPIRVAGIARGPGYWLAVGTWFEEASNDWKPAWAYSADGKTWTTTTETSIGKWVFTGATWDGEAFWITAAYGDDPGPGFTGPARLFRMDPDGDPPVTPDFTEYEAPSFAVNAAMSAAAYPAPLAEITTLELAVELEAPYSIEPVGPLALVVELVDLETPEPTPETAESTADWWWWAGSGSTGAGPIDDAVLDMAPFVSGAVAGAPTFLRNLGDPDPGTLSLELFRHPDYVTPLAEIATTSGPPVDGAFQKKWQDRLNEPGSAEFTVPWQSDLLDLVQFDDLVRISHRGQAVMMMVVDDETRRTIAATEADQTTTFAGPGHLNMMSEAVVYPTLGIGVVPVARDRVFNWTSPEFDDSSWKQATSLGSQNDTTFPYWVGLPPNWPDPTADWVWASRQDPSYPGLTEWSPAGTCYFRTKFTVPAGVYRIAIFFTADASGFVYLDSQQIFSTDNGAADPTDVRTEFFDVTPGDHYLAAQVTNDIDPEGDMVHNPAGLLMSVYAADTTGTLGTLITNTDHFTTKIVEYPPFPPGMTPGEVLRIVLTEAQFRGELVGWTWTFDDEVDSAGNAWPTTGDIGTKVGTDYLAFLGELIEHPWIDVRAQPGGLVLDAYVSGMIGESTGVDFHPPTDTTDPWSGNITELTHHRRSKTATRMLIGSQFPWRHVDATPDGERVKTATLGLGAVPSPYEADRIATGQLETYADIRAAYTLGIQPSDDDDSPYLAFRNGDTVTAPDVFGTPTEVEVKSITGEEDENGVVTFSLEVNDVFVEAAERYATTLKKMSNGTLQGDHPVAKVATPINQLPATPATCCTPDAPT